MVHKTASDLTIYSYEPASWAPTHHCDPLTVSLSHPHPYLTDRLERAHGLGVLHSPLGKHDEGESSKMSLNFPRVSPRRTSQETGITSSEYWAYAGGGEWGEAKVGSRFEYKVYSWFSLV